jgi:hypothetical protein
MRILLLTSVTLAALSTTCFAHHGGGGHHHTVIYTTLPSDLSRLIWGNNPPDTWLFGPQPPQQVVVRKIVVYVARCEPLNVQVIVPNGPWVKQDPREIGSHTNFLIARRHPDITISLAGERVGVEANETNHSLLAASREKIKSFPGGVVLPSERPLWGQNIQGVSYDASATEDGTTAHYAIWVAAHHGYNYKLAVFGEQKDRFAIDMTMRNFVHGLRQIEPMKVAHADTKVKVAVSDRDGAREE